MKKNLKKAKKSKASEAKKKLNLLMLVKSVDGGTGTFVVNMQQLKKMFGKNGIFLNTLVLERPTFRDTSDYDFKYYRKKKHYPEKYSFNIKNIFGFVSEFFWIKKQIGITKPDLIITIDLRCNLLGIINKILFARHVKIIATNHIDLARTLNDKSTKFTYWVLKHLTGYFYNRADVVSSVSRDLSKKIAKDFSLKSKCLTVYDGADFPRFKPKKFSGKRKKIIVTVARLVEQKDHENLIYAFDLLRNEFAEAELWILSDGVKRKELERLVSRLGLNKHIRFLGWVSIEKYLKMSDLFVLSSKREGFGYVLIEAMAHGLPVVSTDTPHGPSEILDKGTYGSLVPMSDPHSMKKAILLLLQNKKKYEHFAKKSVERSMYFSGYNMAKGYKDLINDLIK